MFLLSKESRAFVGHRYPVLTVNVQLFFSSSQLLLKFVDVSDLHPVHERQPLQSKTHGRRREVSTEHLL